MAVEYSVLAWSKRANPIESFDTIAARITTDAGAELLLYASHAVEADYGPVFHYEFSDAVITYDGGDAPIIAQHHDGRTHQSSIVIHPLSYEC